ncbi:cytochrome P450 [Coniophora puteana RWD-64-598 SS2]|uniref:Cytochrome P450 n=1 Tax=Coniophora puteana (strain RWD-64-598) TaxID=741705 RepID=A0A5M3MTG4_CONPW|nr:cytochrome P450 [Coniophora puteana RWD-64-598 SS2]EIW81955.1 cytochrome P450 [Coniophora puteana RWD-64-598 SS2]
MKPTFPRPWIVWLVGPRADRRCDRRGYFLATTTISDDLTATRRLAPRLGTTNALLLLDLPDNLLRILDRQHKSLREALLTTTMYSLSSCSVSITPRCRRGAPRRASTTTSQLRCWWPSEASPPRLWDPQRPKHHGLLDSGLALSRRLTLATPSGDALFRRPAPEILALSIVGFTSSDSVPSQARECFSVGADYHPASAKQEGSNSPSPRHILSFIMSWSIPPGFVWIALNLPRLLLAPTLAYGALRVLRTHSAVHLPTWLNVIICIGSLPVVFTLNVLYSDWRIARDAAARGAVLPPAPPTKLPGGIERLLQASRRVTANYVADAIGKITRAYGPTVNMRLLWENRIVTTEPAYIKAILATQFTSFAKGPFFRDTNSSLLGVGVFNADGDIWKFHRSMTRPFFSKDRIGHFDVFDKHAEDGLNQTRTRLREGHPVDFQDMVSRFTLDSATEFLFGKDVCSLSAGLVYPPSSVSGSAASAADEHPANKFAHAFVEAQKLSSKRGLFGSTWRLREFWRDEVKEQMKVCRAFIDPILEEALARKRETRGQSGEKVDAEEGETLLEHLVNCTEDQTVIRDEILNIMIAGRDTTACSLTMSVYMLSQHPDVLRRLREEVLTKVGASRRPSYDDMRDMKYMRAFINEVLRLYPPVPNNTRTSTEPAVWPGLNGGPPVYVPANTRTPYSVFLMQRRKDLWGPDADLFDPDRFLDSRLHKYLTPNPFIFVPFNAGPRICLGQQFAYNETSFFLVRLLQMFSSIALAEDVQTMPPPEWAAAGGRQAMEKVVIQSHLTMYVKDGLWVRMGEANPVEVV